MMRLPLKQPRGTIKYKKRYDRDVSAEGDLLVCHYQTWMRSYMVKGHLEKPWGTSSIKKERGSSDTPRLTVLFRVTNKSTC